MQPTTKYLPKDGNHPKYVAARLGEIYISIIRAFIGTKDCNHSQCAERIIRNFFISFRFKNRV